MMEPDTVYKVRVSLQPISNLFKAGHRIRLDVASSNFPRFDVNPNTGEPMGNHTRTNEGPQHHPPRPRPPLPRRPASRSISLRRGRD